VAAHLAGEQPAQLASAVPAYT